MAGNPKLINLNDGYLIYPHNIKINSSSYKVYSTKDNKNIFKSDKGISRTTYELLRLISAITIKNINE